MMSPTLGPTPTGAGIVGRQVWSSPTSHVGPPHCTAFALPANGVLVMNSTVTITLQTDAVYQPFCTDEATVGANGTLPISDFQDPFVSSTIPQVFVIGAMLMIAWTLFLILIITPRTSFFASDYGHIIGRGRGSTVMGSGGRPILQKVAALTVLVSLLIAATNSLRVAYTQYSQGFEDARALTNEVVGSLEMRIIMIISDTFLWLAQVQTLIRLFPRHREKVIIKWTGFALILLDTIFSIMDNFVVTEPTRYFHKPQHFNSAIAALSYLFQLALSVVYMSSIVFYSIVKRRFAYYHPKMRNICVVALLSWMSIAVPVVFFVVDIADDNMIGWGDYVRWVGAAAASVVVWEWVERIEALERQERKDGILGREIFDGDDVMALRSWSSWPKRRQRRHGWGDGTNLSSNGSGSGGGGSSSDEGGLSSAKESSSVSTKFDPTRFRSTILSRFGVSKRPATKGTGTQSTPSTATNMEGSSGAPSRNAIVPPTVASPVSRSDNTSAASTVYAVIHHPMQDAHLTQSALSPITSGELRRSNDTPESSGLDGMVNSRMSDGAIGAQSSTPASGADAELPRAPFGRPLRSRLARPFRRIEATEVPLSGQSPAPPSSPSSITPSAPPSAPSSSRRRFRLGRRQVENANDLPLYVIRGGDNGIGLHVERPSSNSPALSMPYTVERQNSPPTIAEREGSRGLPADEHVHRSSSASIEPHIPSYTPPIASTHGLVRQPLNLRTTNSDDAPPSFNAATSTSSGSQGPSLAYGSEDASQVTRVGPTAGRLSPRSLLGMPPLLERDAENGVDEWSPVHHRGGEHAAMGVPQNPMFPSTSSAAARAPHTSGSAGATSDSSSSTPEAPPAAAAINSASSGTMPPNTSED